MNLLPFRDADNTPNACAAFVNCVLIQALYNQNREPLDEYAAAIGGSVEYFQVDPASFPVDCAIIVKGTDALALMSGTTNRAQWIAHFGSFIIHENDTQLGYGPIPVYPRVVTSFYNGLRLIESDIDAVLTSKGITALRIAGHSYGGAAAFIWSRHQKKKGMQRVEVMTFGEPRSYNGINADLAQPDTHDRIVAVKREEGQVINSPIIIPDPVSLVPPAHAEIYRVSLRFKWIKFLDLDWLSFGQQWNLSSNSFEQPGGIRQFIESVPTVFVPLLVTAFNNLELHFMPSSYLPLIKDLAVDDGCETELRFFARRYQQMIQLRPRVFGVLGPPATAAEMNAAYLDASTPAVTDANRSEWNLVSAAGFFAQGTFESENAMSFFKGTLEFNSGDPNAPAGWGESVYSTIPNETATSMMSKMVGLLTKRMLLSVGKDNRGCLNAVVPVAVRVEDELMQRDAFTLEVAPFGIVNPGSGIQCPIGFTSGSDPTLIQNQNLDLMLGARIKYVSGNPLQEVDVTYHGLPVYAFPPAGTGANATATQRYANPNASWLGFLRGMTTYMAQQGLGFRSIAGAWNGPNNVPGPYSAPDAWYYNPTLEMVELQWLAVGGPTNPPNYPTAFIPYTGAPAVNLQPQAYPTWPQINAKCRLQVRQWKSFAVLQNRWPAQVVKPYVQNTAPNPYTAVTGPFAFALRILRKIRQPQDGTVPMVSPIAWVPWYPAAAYLGSSFNPVTQQIPDQESIRRASQFQFVESKKLGRPYDLERGRARNRPT